MNIFKKTYKVLTETNKVKFIVARTESEVRIKMYQLVGSETFIIREI
jgi:hypothetical protein